MFANILGCQALLLLFVLLISCFFLTHGRYRYLYILYKTWRRDLRGLSKVFPAMYRIAKCEKNQETIPKLFTKIAKSRPHKVAFYFEDETWTFGQIEDYSNKIANYFISLGYEKGDTVALLLENRPEYAAIWIGLSKIGVVTALINTNLVSKPLQHCISVAKVRALIFGSDFASAVKEIYPESGEIKLYHFKTSPSAESRNGVLDIKECISNQSVASPQKHMDMSNTKDKLLYIYTSGTTGLPKAAKITHARFNFAVTGINYFLSLGENDNFYNPLPLYHATGGMLTVGQTLIFGVTMTLRRKFSASNFWTDCNKYNCTVANYIGETCRYILAAHKGKPTITHGVKKMFGNGLKKDVWKDFVETFNIPELFEFYGSTEGNTNLINLDNTIGSVGFLPFYLGPIFSICLIKCDDETKEPLRDANGLCIRCKDNEPGILIGKIYKKISTHNFDGYVDQKETNKKILQDVFQKGDSYFNSGDMMVQDEFGYLYFRDRTGDTYRWKGENVATTEVELVVSDVIGPKDIVVYGVELQWMGKPLSADQLGYGEQAYVLSDEAPIRAENRDSKDWTALRILIEKNDKKKKHTEAREKFYEDFQEVVNAIPKTSAVIVMVPKTDGKAGMIAVADEEKSLDRKALAEGLKAHLPAYAIPIFLRVMDSLPMTGTFKVKKNELQKDGYDVNLVKEDVYVYDSKKVDYVPIKPLYEDILVGKIKL